MVWLGPQAFLTSLLITFGRLGIFFLEGLTLAMSILPEEILAVSSIPGPWRLPALENQGSCKNNPSL